jgi:hypothetical protein
LTFAVLFRLLLGFVGNRSTTINYCPNTITNHVRLGNNLRHFTRTREINFCSGACIRQFSTTKPLKTIIFNGFESRIIVNSTINKLRFDKQKSILLLPSFNDYSELKKSFSIVCSKLKPGTYNLIFYFYVKLASYSISPAYYRINAKEFVKNNKLTVGYVEVFRLKLDTLFYLDIYLGLLSDKVNKSSEVLLIIEAVDNANQSADALMVEDEFYEPERAVAGSLRIFSH